MKHSNNNEFDICITNTGHSEWPRYQVKNAKGMFWNGNTWVKDSLKGSLYYWYDEAAVAIKTIEQDLNKGKPVVRYEIPMICEVIGDNPLDPEQLMDYLSKGVRLNLTLPNPDGLVIQIQINVGSLKEIKNVASSPKPQ
jgi:hypothetical protein